MNGSMAGIPIGHLPVWAVWGLWALVGLALVLCVWALLGDWARRIGKRTRRCPRCWYSMEGAAGLTCPECGRDARSERRLLKSRRRWGWSVVGVILMLLAGVGLWAPTMPAELAVRRMPNWMLLWMLDDPCVDPPPNVFVQSPPGAPELTLAQILAHEAWQRDSDREFSRQDRRTLASKQFTLERPPLNVQCRDTWPTGVPMWIEVSSWIQGVRARSIRASSAWEGTEIYTQSDLRDVDMGMAERTWGRSAWAMYPNGAYRDWSSPVLVCVGAPPSGATEVSLDAEISESGEVIWSGRVSEKLRIVGSIDEAITPVRDEALTETIREHLAAGLALGSDRVHLEVRPMGPRSPGLAIGVTIELLEGDVVRWTARDVLTDPLIEPGLLIGFQSNTRWIELQRRAGSWPSLAEIRAPRWKLRVRGDGELALRRFKATSYWAGSFELPVDRLLNADQPSPETPDR